MGPLHASRPRAVSPLCARQGARALQRTRAVAVAVVLALLVGISGGPVASAQEAPPPAGAESAPDIFEPGAINETPAGSAAPAGSDQPSSPAGLAAPGEVVERRTEDSRTLVTEDGRFETTFYSGAIHFRDAHGAWQPIDNSLVPAEGSNGALRNAAGSVGISLPGVLGAEPVRVAKGDVAVAFTFKGATGTPSPGTPKALAARSSEAATKASATYANALPGVDVGYTAMPEGVKEDVVLAGPDAPTSFDFTVETSPGLTATQTAAGGIDFVDGEGNARATFAPPFAYDASFKATGAEGAFTDDAVSLSIVETAPQLVVRLAADPGWLAAPERAWPVVVDPTLTIGSAAADTHLSKSQPSTNYGTAPHIQLSAGSSVRRPVYAKAIQDFFDEPVTVVGADLQLMPDIFTIEPPGPVAAHAITKEWNATQATWNNRLTGVAWSSAGGDFASQRLSVVENVGAPDMGRFWDITKAAQAWVDGEPNHGVLLKHVDEAAGAHIYYHSSENSDATMRPRIVVEWEPLAGLRSPYAFEDFDLGEAGAASVNVASGNLTIADRDLAIAGTGPAATVDRFFQSRIPGKGSVGPRWRMWPQSEERLYVLDSGHVRLFGGGDELVMFTKNHDRTYSSPHGYRATLTYDSAAAVYKLKYHESATVHTFTSPGGYLRDIVDRNGNKISFGYVYNSSAEEYYMASMTDTQGRVTTFQRASEHMVTKMVDPAGRAHAYAYDTLTTNLASYTDPAGRVTHYDYGTLDTGALVTRITDPNGNATTFGYDGRNRLTSLTRVTDALLGTGPTWRFSYSTPWQTKVTDPKGNATTHHFDRRGRVTKVVDALGRVRQASYDANSNVIDRTSATGAKSIATFDTNSNLRTSQLPTGAKATLDYTHATHKYSPTKLTNPQGNAWTLGYDTPGNLKTVTDSMATAGVTTFAYNPNGTLASSTDAKGAITTYGYDAKGNLIKVTPPAPLGATTTGYDGLSRVTSTTDGKGQTTTYAYDALDRPTRIGFADGLVVTLRYDPGGRLVERTDATGTTTYVYDRLNRISEERLPGGRVNAYTYDTTGNLTSMTDATGKVTYSYNAVNLVTSLVEPDSSTTTFAYDDDNNRTLTSYPNGVAQSAAYDASSRLKTIEGKRGTTVLTRFAYHYDLAGVDTGLRQRMIDKDSRTTTYTYDALDRLKRAQTAAGTSVVADHAYDYDAVGNRISETVNGTTTTAVFNAADQVTSRAGVTYSYDLNGNQTGSSAGQALVYNAADQTTSLKRAGGTALAATYAGANQAERATAGATTFTNSMLGVSVATDASATAYTRDPAGGLVGIRGANRSYYLLDGLGSVVAVTDANGAVTNTYTYDPYGDTTETKAAGTNVSNPWRYAGQYQDVSTGLYKMGARYYQPELGRWTQQDPSGQDANAYAYVGGNPVNFIDPTGLYQYRNCGEAFLQFIASGVSFYQALSSTVALALAPDPTFLTKAAMVGTASLVVASGLGIADAAEKLHEFDCG